MSIAHSVIDFINSSIASTAGKYNFTIIGTGEFSPFTTGIYYSNVVTDQWQYNFTDSGYKFSARINVLDSSVKFSRITSFFDDIMSTFSTIKNRLHEKEIQFNNFNLFKMEYSPMPMKITDSNSFVKEMNVVMFITQTS